MKFPYPLRFEHCYIPGKTGHGKTTLLQRMALKDILNGAGVTFIDPGGDAVSELIHHVPETRKDDCIYLDLEHPIPFDFLTYDRDYPLEKDELVKDLSFIVLKGITNAPRAESILLDLFYTLLACSIPVCFLDVYYFLTKSRAPWGDPEKNRFDEIFAALPDQSLRHRWQHYFPTDEKKEPIITRFTPFVRNSTLRKLFGTPDPPLKIADVMNKRQILLVNIGGASRAAAEYGALLFAKMRQEVFRRHRVKTYERIPHFVFIDEFQTLPNPETFRDCLMMARKYKLSLTLANLTLQDPDLDARTKAALGIVTNYIIFCLNGEDVRFFKHIKVPPQWNGLDLGNFPKYTALYKLGSEVVYQETPKPLGFSSASFAESIRKRTLEQYGCIDIRPPYSTERSDAVQDKPSDISAGKAPNVPSHSGKKKNA